MSRSWTVVMNSTDKMLCSHKVSFFFNYICCYSLLRGVEKNGVHFAYVAEQGAAFGVLESLNIAV